MCSSMVVHLARHVQTITSGVAYIMVQMFPQRFRANVEMTTAISTFEIYTDATRVRNATQGGKLLVQQPCLRHRFTFGQVISFRFNRMLRYTSAYSSIDLHQSASSDDTELCIACFLDNPESGRSIFRYSQSPRVQLRTT